jgi:hypothetical protein
MWFSKNSIPSGSAAAKPLGQTAQAKPSAANLLKKMPSKVMSRPAETTKRWLLFKAWLNRRPEFTMLGHARK